MRDRFSLPKPEHGSDEWLALRWADEQGKRRLNASTAAVLFNRHPYVTQGQLAAIQLAPDPPHREEPSDAQDRGLSLEPALLAWYGRQVNIDVEPAAFMLGRGRFMATVDGIGTDNRIVEAKTTTDWVNTTPEMPEHWKWQGVAQAYVADKTVIHWVVLDRHMRLSTFIQEVTDQEIETLVQMGDWWLSFIDMGMVPQGVEQSVQDVMIQHPVEVIAKTELPASAGKWVTQLKDARLVLKEYKGKEQEARSKLAVLLKDAAVGCINGREIVSWKASSPRHKFAADAFKREYPELWDRFYQPSPTPTRVMRILGVPIDPAAKEEDDGED